MTWCHYTTQPDYLAQSVEMINIDSDRRTDCYNISPSVEQSLNPMQNTLIICLAL